MRKKKSLNPDNGQLDNSKIPILTLFFSTFATSLYDKTRMKQRIFDDFLQIPVPKDRL